MRAGVGMGVDRQVHLSAPTADGSQVLKMGWSPGGWEAKKGGCPLLGKTLACPKLLSGASSHPQALTPEKSPAGPPVACILTAGGSHSTGWDGARGPQAAWTVVTTVGGASYNANALVVVSPAFIIILQE